MGDLKTFHSRYRALRQCIITDGIRNGVPFSDKDLQRIVERLSTEGTSFVKVTLPKLGKALDQGLVSGQFLCCPGFALKGDSRLPVLLHQCFSGIFAGDGTLLAEPNITTIRYLRLFLLFDSKLEFQPTSLMEEEAVQGFSDRMQCLSRQRVPKDHPVLQRAQHLLGKVLSSLDLSSITPGHGPGAVAEKIERDDRWDFQTWNLKAESSYPFLTYGVHSPSVFFYDRNKTVTFQKKALTRCCLVPKDFKGPRLISAEGVVNQYLQQGQMQRIMKYVKRHRLLNRSIKLQDQTYNQRAARDAYASDSVTVDLSNASDTVSAALVWYLLAKVPKLRRHLFATRSDAMIYKDRSIRITSFAPMGSATCFPIETLVFWAISMASMLLARRGSKPLNELADSLRVFGDDIIIPEYAFEILRGTFLSVGFEINKSKTCYLTPFRESCGSEWFLGQDVTIIRNKLYQYPSCNKFSDYPVLLNLQRKFFLQGLNTTASLLVDWAKEIYPVVQIPTKVLRFTSSYMLPLDALRSSSMYYHGRTRELFLGASSQFKDCELDFFEKQILAYDAYHCALGSDYHYHGKPRLRFNDRYQRVEAWIPTTFNRSRDWHHEGYPRLLARLLHDQIERVAIRHRKMKMTWAWIPGLWLSPEN